MSTGRQAKEKSVTNHRGSGTPTMRAVLQEGYGSADVLRVGSITRPAIAPDEVIIRVHAAGLDRGTWHIMTGLPYVLRLAFGFRTPKNPVPGLDLSGTVEAVGAKVSRFAVGDQVFGVGKGSFAEFASARERQLAHKPASITFEQAAVVPVSACTALQALRAAGVDPVAAGSSAGKRVLVTGASGGVGSYAVQFAKAAGADVTAVCSAGKADLVRSLGADHVIDYAIQDFASGPVRYDVIVDIAGNPSLKRLRGALTPTGTAVITGGEEGGSWTGSLDRQFRALAWSWFIRQKLTMVIGSEGWEDLATISGLLEAGTIVPAIDQTFPLEQVPEAMRYFDAGKVRGKIAITVGPWRAQ
ncbi:NAD(P)-dependent alcohol dehydrogenase [Paenarthrobacter sp. NPDC089322]|uniref:NAD(P)-dependent alcohol dehydrogenase n=1 Tax=Paenarthrobacter sp. NPDC089322 TaxID=3155065 RepID=UPI0034135EAF